MSTESTATPVAVSPESTEVETPEVETTEEQPVEAAEEKKIVEEIKKANKKKYELKVNNKSKEIEIDLDNDEEVRKYLQKAMASEERFQEAAMTRKQAEQLIETLRTNPLAILKHPDLGLDIKKLAEQVLMEELEEADKSPEQKRIEELEKALKSREEREKALEDEKREAEMSKMQQEAMQQLDEDISAAIATSNLPKSPYVIKRIADTMIEAVNMGYTDVTVKDIMPLVEEQVTSEIQRLFEESPDEVFEKIVGKKKLDSYRKARVAKAKQPIETLKQIKETAKVPEKKQEAPKQKFKDLFKPF